MFYKYLYLSTTPFLWVLIMSWWLDRFFVELGHRSSATEFCSHNKLQYVQIHQWMSMLLCIAQTVYFCHARMRSIRRELRILKAEIRLCTLIPFYIICCCMTTVILGCILDVSPWLCVSTIVEMRAIYTATACVLWVASFITERSFYHYLIERAVVYEHVQDEVDI